MNYFSNMFFMFAVILSGCSSINDKPAHYYSGHDMNTGELVQIISFEKKENSQVMMCEDTWYAYNFQEYGK